MITKCTYEIFLHLDFRKEIGKYILFNVKGSVIHEEVCIDLS